MTHQFKTPGANVVVYSTGNRNQRQEKQDSFVDQIMNRVRSKSGDVRENIKNHYGLWIGIGLACGVVVYLFATEHGRNLQTQVRKSVGSSLDTAKDTVIDRFNHLTDATIDMVNKAISEDDMTENTSEMPSLRRVG